MAASEFASQATPPIDNKSIGPLSISVVTSLLVVLATPLSVAQAYQLQSSRRMVGGWKSQSLCVVASAARAVAQGPKANMWV